MDAERKSVVRDSSVTILKMRNVRSKMMFDERKDRHKLIDVDLRQKQVNEGTVPSSECDGTMKHTTKLPLPQLFFFLLIVIKKSII